MHHPIQIRICNLSSCRSFVVLLAGLCALILSGRATADETLLLRMPDISRTHISFVYAGDIWVADRDGAHPRRLTVHPGMESHPYFSPDGKWLAFSGNYEGNTDVYVVPVEGGQPRRLTFHPQADVVRGWTPSGEKVLFTSPRELTYQRGGHLWQVGRKGGYPQRLPMPVGYDGAFSPDGARIAYQPFAPANSGPSGWKRYRGGTTPPIWLFDLKSHEIERVPHPRVNDTAPMWVGDTVYFLSDRNRIVNIFAYSTRDHSVRQLTHSKSWDISSANATHGAIIYAKAGRLHELDLASAKSQPVPISIHPDLPETRPHWVDAAKFVQRASLSPSGKRAVFEARSDILTVPAKKGDIRNLTRTSGVQERDPLWSPDGKQIAYLSDASGEYQLVVSDQVGRGKKQNFTLGGPAFYYLHAWSPDNTRIVYEDNHLNIYALTLKTGKTQRLDQHAFSWLGGSEVAFSPDSRWLAYTKVASNYMQVLQLYDFKNARTFALSEGMSDVGSPVFSRDGKYLFFTASTDAGPATAWLDMSSQEKNPRRGIYAAVLAADARSPIPPESDEEGKDEEAAEDTENGGEKKDKGQNKNEKKPLPVRVDRKGLRNRIVALPVAERIYSSLAVTKDGNLLYLDNRPQGVSNNAPGGERRAVNQIRTFDFKKREDRLFMDHVAGFSIGADGSKLLVQGPKSSWSIVDSGKKPDAAAKPLPLASMRVHVDPRAEWPQIFKEGWRQMRDFFYDPGMHGADWQAVYEKYRPLVDYVGRREDLNTIMIDMVGELVVGHARIFGGDFVTSPGAKSGLLGADFSLQHGRYRFAHIYTGESWNPFLKAPLGVPGANVKEGDYLLAINGRRLQASDNLYAFLEGTVGKQIVLSVNRVPRAKGARDITVIPVACERDLRRRDWIEANRRKVNKMTDGRVGYIYLPNTAGAGFTYFNRYFYEQLDKQALVVDERGNSGGQAANYIIDQLSRTYTASWKQRDGKLFTTPVGGIFGPKVMLIDMFAGSGGDFMPYSFRYRGVGKLIGTRTWGGLVGGGPGPAFMDGGRVNLPFLAFIRPDGQWAIENEGVPPDIEVEMTPKAVIDGHDPQLEKGVEVVLDALKTWKPVKLQKAPPFRKRALE